MPTTAKHRQAAATAEIEELRRLRRENAELRRANDRDLMP